MDKRLEKQTKAPAETEKDRSSSPFIEAENLSFTYRGNEALSHVNFSFYPGEFAALVGSNGELGKARWQK
ncbi:hypothetical protein ACE1TI_04995 [Alteribacillus sp. JSM 102045]|uniref:hypothetical protein n=1 Tax=Alteribacillus sp. JSM 102045 TaxID=1562101 RepID=UPI0035C1888E